MMHSVGYKTHLRRIDIPNSDSLLVRSLLDRQQYWDPEGKAARQGISSALWPLFGLLWPSSIYLAGQMATYPMRAGEQVLEIGCGLALPSLACHRRGMAVTASDRHPLARKFLHTNLRLNRLPATLRYRHANWSTLAPGDGLPLSGRYDLIIGSDLLYERNAPRALAHFIACHASARSQVWLVEADRGYHNAITRHLANHGFVRSEQTRLHREPCLSGATRYRGRLLKYRRTQA